MVTSCSICPWHFLEQVLELEIIFLAAASLQCPVTVPSTFLTLLTWKCIVQEEQIGQDPASPNTDQLTRKADG